MEVLYPPGKCEILAILIGLKGEDPLEVIELAGRTAYQSQSKIKEGSAEKFVRILRNLGHESVIEHSCMTVRFSNVSRGFTHEQVRHRLISVTQESTRYVAEKIVELALPGGESVNVSFQDWISLNEQMYRGLRKAGWVAEDARQILPIGIVSEIVITANFREWRHIFSLRGAPDAHWEIRMMVIELLKKAQQLVPVVFDDFEVDSSVPCIRKKTSE